MVQRYVLEQIPDPRLKVYIVWEAIHPSDSPESARQASVFVPDQRVRHFWSAERFAGKAFREAVGLKSMPAWDVFLAFSAGKTWGSVSPNPDYLMHNLRNEAETPQCERLNGVRLAHELETLLKGTIPGSVREPAP